MKHIKQFEDFLNENLNENIGYDQSTLLYLEGDITYEQWENEFDILNEGKLNDFFKNKIMPILNTIKEKITTIGQKGLKLLQKIYSFIKGLSKKYPVFFKFVIILIVILLITTISAMASNIGGSAENAAGLETVLSNAIGFLESIDTGEDMMEVLKAKAYLVDLKDGVIDNPEIVTEKAKSIADAAINSIKTLNKTGDLDKSFYDIGKNIIDYSYNIIKKPDGFQEYIEFVDIKKIK